MKLIPLISMVIYIGLLSVRVKSEAGSEVDDETIAARELFKKIAGKDIYSTVTIEKIKAYESNYHLNLDAKFREALIHAINDNDGEVGVKKFIQIRREN
uniref:Uncharacterized protein n=1 Tax=Nilaparvata lugens TaxID=108931 RepID=A0A220XIR4_NILLU|nr:hypothetical protein [Nilaparvata lugens]